VTARSQPPSTPHQQTPSPLVRCLTGLAGTPDDSSAVDRQLDTIAQLAADLVAPVSYASVTAYRDDAYTTVAASSEVALAVDEAQYHDREGPCLTSLEAEAPVAVSDFVTTMRWPGFREAAFALGLRASLSVPLFAGRGSAIAALNLYGRDPEAMAPLIAAVWGAFEADGPALDTGPDLRRLDDGSAGLVAGITGAFAVRAVIHQAIGVIIADTQRSADAAYVLLRMRAAERGLSLSDVAADVVAEKRWSRP
jgi:hypothetical protein